MFSIVVALIGVALFFDYINGFHDAANSIATVVSTRVLSPGKAVIWAAFFNFVAAFTFGTAVASTVGAGMIDINVVTFAVIFGGLTGAIVWDLITWYFGLPTSSSHALIGGYAGAAVAKAGFAAIIPARLDEDASSSSSCRRSSALRRARVDDDHLLAVPRDAAERASTLVPPAAAAVGRVLQPQPRRQRRAEDDGDHRRHSVRGRLHRQFLIPFWVVLAAHAAIALGTLAGGWRIIHTMGSKITKLQPVGGFAAETGAAIALLTATHSACPSAPRTRLPDRLSASARRDGCRRSGGASPGRSSGRGS